MVSVPKSKPAVERDYVDYIKNKKFKQISKEAYPEYLLRSQKDLTSSYRDLEGGDHHWAFIKAYQALFFVLNALLIKYKGYFSKDHKCIITALLKEEVISIAVAEHIDLFVKALDEFKTLDEVDDLRLDRNKAMYAPTAWKDFKKQQAESVLNEARDLINKLVELL